MRSAAFAFVALLAVTLLAAPCDAKGGSSSSDSSSSSSSATGAAMNLVPSVGIAAASAVMAAAIVNRL
ncbi:hypothetical protein IWQ62_004484 [Dispira parvispora]|uniref:Uncharacterized protein n=1 Tax=Dispira parvispora TaxID=1520584 RepID=A0A9W8AS89_9FUNG|nr:hypothetical protein IWQ62_004484 [Dispira parvispora]